MAVVISEAFTGGGNTGAPYARDFVVLHNTSDQPFSLTGKTLQYATPTGSSWSKVPLTGTIAAGGYYLISLGQGTAGTGAALPAADAVLDSLNLRRSSGKLALVELDNGPVRNLPDEFQNPRFGRLWHIGERVRNVTSDHAVEYLEHPAP